MTNEETWGAFYAPTTVQLAGKNVSVDLTLMRGTHPTNIV
jgi:hypothetical protein